MATDRVIYLILIFNIYGTFSSNSGDIDVILERSQLTCDNVWMIDCNCSVYRHNRSTPYMMNMHYCNTEPLDKGVNFTLKSYEWKNNQFKESFISFDRDFCDFLEKDVWIMGMLKNHKGIPKKCPVKPGTFSLNDFRADISRFPKGFPMSKWKFDFGIVSTKLKKVIFQVELQFRIERIVNNKGKNKSRSKA